MPRAPSRPGLRCVYVSPLRSLGYDIERNLSIPIEAIRQGLGLEKSPVTVGVRTGDTSAHHRRKLRDEPPHLLITTPESLSLMLSQSAWHEIWRGVRHLIVDEVHALVPNKRGADLAVSLERLAGRASTDPARVGLSATCRPAEPVARFLVGPSRACRVVEAPMPEGSPGAGARGPSRCSKPDEAAASGPDLSPAAPEAPRGHPIGTGRRSSSPTPGRSPRRSPTTSARSWTSGPRPSPPTTRRSTPTAGGRSRRRSRRATLRAVVTSTSLELGVDIGQADLSVLVGLPGSASRCLQRVGRAGHRVGVGPRGLLLAATPAELAGAVVTAEAARAGRVEPLRPIRGPLDVLCQQLIGMACGGEWSADDAYALVRKSAPMADLSRADFDACLDFLAGDLAAPPGAFEPEPGSAPRWTAPRIWKRGGCSASGAGG